MAAPTMATTDFLLVTALGEERDDRLAGKRAARARLHTTCVRASNTRHLPAEGVPKEEM